MSQKFYSEVKLETLDNATTDTDHFLVGDSGTIKYRTGAEVLSDIGGQPILTNPITGTGTTNYVSKFTGTTSLGNSQIFDNGSGVGIGTTSPSEKLSVYGNAEIDSNNAASQLYFYNSGTALGSIGKGNYAVSGADFNGISMYSVGAMSFASGGQTERMRITSSGSVGIGTASPNFITAGRTVLSLNGSSTSLIEFQAGSDFKSYFYQSGTSFEIYETNTLLFAVNGSERMRIASNGNVGIGTSSPFRTLDVNGTLRLQSPTIDLGNSTDNQIWVSSNNINFKTNNSEKVIITSAGNVGIGTTSPNALLDVNGDALINGLTIGLGGGYISTNTAIGRDVLDSNTSGGNNIAIGYNTLSSLNRNGNTVIGCNLNLMPNGVDLIDSNSNLIVGQYNDDFGSVQVPHIYAPDKIYCPQGDVTNLLEIDYSLYTAVFIEYSIYNSGGDQFRAGRFVAAFKSTGTPEYRDYPEVVFSGTTAGADFIIGYGGTYPVIQLDNQGGDDYFLRFTSRLLMR